MSFPHHISYVEVSLLKVIYPVCCSVDVHKSFLVATVISTTSGVQPKYIRKRFSTFNGDLRIFANWLISNNCNDVCMESTGKYWIPVFNILEDFNINVPLQIPNGLKPLKETRTIKRIPNG